MKLARGEKLNPIELAELEQQFNEMDNNRIIVSSWQQMDKKIKPEYFDLPFNVIYSTVLEQDVDSLTIEIPSFFNHLLIMVSGSLVTDNNPIVCIRFNGDTGNNYSSQYIFAVGSSILDGSNTGSSSFLGIGAFPNSDVSPNESGSCFCVITHYNSFMKKKSLALSGFLNDVRIVSGLWKDTSAIENITFLGLPGDNVTFDAGSIFSVYGIR